MPHFKSSGMEKPPDYFIRLTESGKRKQEKALEDMIIIGTGWLAPHPSDYEIVRRPSFLDWAKRTK